MTAITVDTKTFTRELEWVARFIERKSTIPVLGNVLFQKRGDTLNMTSTDLEVGGSTSIELEDGDAPDFELTAPVHLLIKYLKKVDEKSVRLLPTIMWSPVFEGPHPESCADECSCGLARSVTDVSLAVQHGEDGSMKVDGIPGASYPVLPSRPLATLELGGFETAIPRALISIDNVESRFTMDGALLVIEGKSARLISTDGHRLSAVDLTAYDAGNKVKAIIPRKTLAELVRLGDSAFFCSNEDFVFFTTGERTIVSRKLKGNFPDYERVLPKDLSYAVDVTVAPFRKALDRVSLFTNERSHAIAVSVNGALTLSARSCDRGAAEGKIAIDCVRRLDGENGYDVLPNGLACPYAAGFNADYIAQFLKAADVSDVRFYFNKCKNAAEWTAPGWRYVLMPMRMGDDTGDPYAVGDFEPVPAVIEALGEAAANAAVEAVAAVEEASAEPPTITIPDATVAPVEPATRRAPIDISDAKARAVALRRQNLSLGAIAKQLGAPQSSVWRWTRGVEASA